MKQGLYAIADISGSMAELGKSGLLRDLCRFLSQYWNTQPDLFRGSLSIYTWSSELTELDTNTGSAIPDLFPTGRADIEALTPLLTQASRDEIPLLLLSDGAFPCERLQEFLGANKPTLSLYTLAVGADADTFSLSRIACDKKAWHPEEIETLLERIFVGMPPAPPVDSTIFSTFPARAAHTEKDDWDD